MVRVLIVGGGGREHALAWKVSKSASTKKLFIAPGNAGTQELGTNVTIGAENIDDLVDFALSQEIDLTLVGPEQPLALGIVDRFREKGLRCFGPTRAAARVETSKSWCKELMARNRIPTASYHVFADAQAAIQHIKKSGVPLVIKADGLAAGKGVVVARTEKDAVSAVEQAMVSRVHGEAGDRVVIEEFLEGEEVSVLALCRGRSYCLLPSSQDHKALYDNDEGPNTGGMGAYAPVPVFDERVEGTVRDKIIEPLLWALEREGAPYSGVLYCGLMLTASGPKVLEFNARFGDPEAQAILPVVEEDLLEMALATIECTPSKYSPGARGYATCVVMASQGYPGQYKKGLPIKGIDDARAVQGVEVFHAGTALKDGRLVTNGGRVLGVTAHAPGLKESIDRAYSAVSRIEFEGAHYRKDIGRKALKRLE